ncbi:hypothetical protein HJ099_10895 [Vibrio parahaemolyticus]|nr:hypothetical protein [Vibrio parahaemolyticus]
MGTTILRFEKIKNFENIKQAGFHHRRQHKKTPNANPNLRKLNRYFYGSSNLVNDVNNRLKNLDKLPRKNAVLAMEGILQLSPELIKPNGKENIEVLKVWFNQSRQWLKKQFGENLVNAVLHRDEQTPHIHFIVVPLIEKNGKRSLSARDMFGKVELSKMQKSYYQAMTSCIPNIRPPKFGSKRSHTDIKHFYAVLDRVKLEMQLAAEKMLEQLKDDCMATLKNKYLPLVDKAIERVEHQIEDSLSVEVKDKIQEAYKQELEKAIDAFKDTPTMNGLDARVEESIHNAKLDVTNANTQLRFR